MNEFKKAGIISALLLTILTIMVIYWVKILVYIFLTIIIIAMGFSLWAILTVVISELIKKYKKQ